jgi:aryl-alcohol dehydrogenase-like predicted oxidoreductase
VHALHEQLTAGLIGAYGASNWRHERIAAANAYAAKQGLQPLVASSPHFSLAEQIDQPWPPGCVSISGPAQEAARAWYAESQTPVLAWSSLSAGFFSGQWTADAIAALPEDSEHLFIRCYRSAENLERLRRTEKLAAARGLSVPELALAWLWGQGLNVFALTGCRTPTEVQSTAAALNIQLSPSECDWLDLKREAP